MLPVMASFVVTRIISGGQTGADRGALDAAMALGLPHGGFCPRGRRAEDGAIPAQYRLRETDSRAYAVRTERNVVESDGTLIICRGPMSGGTALTARLAAKHARPLLSIDLQHEEATHGVLARAAAAQAIRTWLQRHAVTTLNVAGPRQSHCPGIADDVHALLVAALSDDGA